MTTSYRLIPISDIIVPPDRQRKEFDADRLRELADSITSKSGMLQPIVLRADSQTLVAGERRLRAASTFIYPLGGSIRHNGITLPHGTLPFVTTSDLTDLELEAAELDENLHRVNLTWQEEAQAKARLVALKSRQAALAGERMPTLASVAAELVEKGQAPTVSAGVATLSDSLILAGKLSNPDVAKAKTAFEAMKIVKNIARQEENAKLAAAVGKTLTSASHTVVNEECLAWMERTYRAGGFAYDVILTDPPYGMGADGFGDAAGKLTGTTHVYDDSYNNWTRLMSQWCELAYGLAAPEAHAYVFCDFDRFHKLKEYMLVAGWDVFRTPILSIKTGGSGRVPRPEHGPRRTYECILYAIKGNKRVTSIQPDTISCAGDDQLGHGAQKPVELYINLLRRSIRPGDRVLDTFGGTGTILPSAHQLRCIATCIEQDPASYGICLKRLETLTAVGS